MYSIGIKHNGVVIATYDLLGEEVKKLEVTMLSFILELFEKKFGLDIGQYGLNEYENEKGYFLLNIRSEDLVKLRDYKLTKLGL
jgi:D-lyxose ketol-isomerase